MEFRDETIQATLEAANAALDEPGAEATVILTKLSNPVWDITIGWGKIHPQAAIGATGIMLAAMIPLLVEDEKKRELTAIVQSIHAFLHGMVDSGVRH